MAQAFFYSFYSKYWDERPHQAYCTVSGVDDPWDPSGIVGGDLQIWPPGGEAYYASNWAFATDITVGPDDTVNVFLTNKMVNPGVNVVFGAFDYETKESVMVVNCNPPQ
jgi:hypothetical protein